MIELLTLGTLDLRAEDGRSLQSVLSQPKRTLLLCYLALATPRGFQQKDTLLGLFWPESDEEAARHALRQSLYFLRRSLGDDVILSRGANEVGISEERLRCDAAELDRALSEGRPEDAVGLYGGELLPGFFISDLPDLEEWLEAQRAALRGRAAEAAWRAAEEKDADGDAVAAAEWAQRAVSLAPGEEAVLRRTMLLLDRLGDRAAAVRAYEAFTWRLREELGIEPSPETADLAEQIRTREEPRRLVEPAADVGASGGGGSTTAASGAATADAAPSARVAELSTRGGAVADEGGRRLRWGVSGLAVIASIVAAAVWYRPAPEPAALDPAVVAVLPFRVAGADPELAYLREGMLDLLAAKLTGESGPRAVDPRTLMAAWRRAVPAEENELTADSARSLARRLGAGRLVLGEVVSAPGHVTIHATLHDIAAGAVGPPMGVTGPPESLPALVDRLALALLSQVAGEVPDRIPSLTGTSLPALRAYLEGQSLNRRGRYGEAADAYGRALELDSTLAPAGIGIMTAAIWLQSRWGEADRGMRLAWAAKDRLSRRDRSYVLALAGPRYPDLSLHSEYLAGWERLVTEQPDRTEAWWELGEILMHYGGSMGLPHARERARLAFERAVDLDPGFAPALQHLKDLSAGDRNRQAYARDSRRHLAMAPAAADTWTRDWERGVLFDDSAAMESLRDRLDTLPAWPLANLIARTIGTGLRLEVAEHAAQRLVDRARTAGERRVAYHAIRSLALNRGQPARASAITDELAPYLGRPSAHLRLRIEDALFANGDTASAASAAAMLAALPELNDAERCALGQWRLLHGDTVEAGSAVARLRSPDPSLGSGGRLGSHVCAEILETLLAELAGRQDALPRLDSLLAGSPPSFRLRKQGNITVARLWEKRGRPDLALRAARRRAADPAVDLYLSTFLGLEAQLAARIGDRDGAARAYRHYLALRSDPEPALAYEVRTMRAELARTSPATDTSRAVTDAPRP